MTDASRISAPAVRRVSAAAVALAGLTLVAAVGASLLALPGPARPVWEVPASHTAIALYIIATCALAVSAAVLVALEPYPPSRLSAGTALVVLALSWAVLVLFVRTDAPPAARFLASVGAALAPAALLHLSAAIARRPVRAARSFVAVGYLLCALPAALRALVIEPFRDPFCRVGCQRDGFNLVASPDLARAVGAILLWGSATVAATALAIAIVGLAGRSAPRSLLGAIGAAALIELVLAVTPTARPGLGPLPEYGELLFVSRCGTAIVLALILIADAAARARRMVRVRAKMEGLATRSQSRSLEDVLAQALGDPHVHVDYWLSSLGAWADGSGRESSASPLGSTVTITRDGAPLARVAVRRMGISAADLDAVVGAAARLVIDNERLRVELLAQARELRASRLRVVQASDAARRRLERDLHDGVQQRLLAASYSFRLAASEASDPLVSAEAERRLAEVLDVLAALRETARGLYPPVLADAGLLPALEALARSASTRLSIDAVPTPFPRLDPAVELTAYLVVREALGHGGPATVSARIARAEGRIRIAAERVPSYRVERVADRIAALGGRMSREGDGLSVEVPCG